MAYELPIVNEDSLTASYWTDSPNTIGCKVYYIVPGGTWTDLIDLTSKGGVVRSEHTFVVRPLPVDSVLWLQFSIGGVTGTPYLVSVAFSQDGERLAVRDEDGGEHDMLVFEGRFSKPFHVWDVEVRLV